MRQAFVFVDATDLKKSKSTRLREWRLVGMTIEERVKSTPNPTNDRRCNIGVPATTSKCHQQRLPKQHSIQKDKNKQWPLLRRGEREMDGKGDRHQPDIEHQLRFDINFFLPSKQRRPSTPLQLFLCSFPE